MSRRPAVPAPDALFDRDSLSWATAGRWWSMFGGQRALLLQVADPRIAAGVADHSDWESHPFARLLRTMDVMLALSFGGTEVREAAVLDLAAAHAPVSGTQPDGSAYSATDADAGAWVFATLIDSMVVAERLFVGRFDDSDRERLWHEARRLAALMHVDRSLPEGWAEFESYVADRVASLDPSDQSRAIAAAVIRPRVGLIPPRWWWAASAIGIDLLPPSVRESLELPALMPASVGWVLRTEERTRKLVRRLPERLSVNPLVYRVPTYLRRQART